MIPMNYEIVLATHNQDKINEFKSFFEGYTVTFLTLSDIKLKLTFKETGRTFLDNALIKAKLASRHVNKTVIAEDSGLQIDALKGFPGIFSARWLEDQPYSVKNQEILKLMEIHKNRKAQFTCAVVMLYPHQELRFFVGTAIGKITREISTGTSGFGYDPIFYSEDLKKTFADVSLQEKSLVSHRGKALEKLRQCLLDRKLITRVRKRT
jgi:XTP/dITP diphosphohydrolase